MSAFRMKIKKPVDYMAVRSAYAQRAIARMVVNGSTLNHANNVMHEKHRIREEKKERWES